MKKQLSKKISAIFTVVAMLALLVTMAAPVMAEETAAETNYIVNGDFADGTMDGWTAVGTADKVTITESVSLVTTEPSLRIEGKQSNGVSQVVTRLTPQKSYKLSMDIVSNQTEPNVGAELTVTFGRYADGTFTALSSAEDYTAPIDTKMDTRRVMGKYDKTVKNISMNLNVPPTADAAEVKIVGRTPNSSGVTIVDNIKLVEGSAPIEMINNGAVEAAFASADSTEYNSAVKNGWERKGSGTISSTIEKYIAEESTEDTEVDVNDGNSYMKLYGHSGVAYWTQDISLRHGKVYKLSFKFSQTGLGTVAPQVRLDVSRDGEADIVPVFTGVSSTDTITWKNYETFITVDKPTEEYEYDLVDAQLRLTSLAESKWIDGGVMYYDDISLVEIDTDTQLAQLAFAAGTNGDFTTTPANANTASCIFIQGETDNAVQTFIVAKYNSTTNALESASVVNAGDGIAAGDAKRYDVDLDDYNSASYYKIFLFDGTTLKPILDSQSMGL